jgi:hypothetical protein
MLWKREGSETHVQAGVTLELLLLPNLMNEPLAGANQNHSDAEILKESMKRERLCPVASHWRGARS